MALLDRLKNLQEPAKVPLTDLSGLTLEQMSQEKITFGQKHLGHTFETAWEDQQWINFMVSKYSSSTVLSHRKLMKFIELKVEKHEQDQMPIPVLPAKESMASGYALTKGPSGSKYIPPTAKSKVLIPTHPEAPIPLDGDEELEFEMYNGGIMDSPLHLGETVPLNENPEFQVAQDRLLQMENALGKVIRHLENQAEQQKSD